MACLQVIPHIETKADTGHSFDLFLFSAVITRQYSIVNKLV